jgi:hypothetical protein
MTVTLDPWQFRISVSETAPGRPVGPALVETGPGLDEVLLEDATGQPVGLLIGFPIDLRGQRRLNGGTHRLNAVAGEALDAFAEKVLEGLAGRFLWLCTAGERARIYLDAAGQVPCVYDPDMRVAASSAFALLSAVDYNARFDAALHAGLGINGLGWIPGGLTAHKGVQRLLPNHILDLEDFTMTRHWPLQPVTPAKDPEAAIATLIETVREQLAALVAGERRVAQALTAGHETRMLLGCARPFTDRMDFATVSAGAGHVDTVMAARIAEGEQLRHRVLPTVMADVAARAAYLRRNGDCIADGNARSFPSVAPIADSHVFVGGAGGEVGRGFFWRPGDGDATMLDGTALMARFGLPPKPRVIAALDAWLAGLAGRGTREILDLAYLEHRMGPWSGAQFPSDPTLVRFAPLLTRPGVVAMMSLPADWKRGEGMSAAVLRQTWPELNRYPFNTLGRLRDTLAKGRKVLRDPTAILRKLRKRFG